MSWGLHPTLPFTPSTGLLCVWASGWRAPELSLAGSIEIILNPLFSRPGHHGGEAAIPGHSADTPSLRLLEQSLSLCGPALSTLL